MMTGNWLHTALIEPVELLALQLDNQTKREFQVRPGRRSGFIDLLIWRKSCRIACEAELRADRISADIDKAHQAGVVALLIVTPTGRSARSIERKVRQLDRTGRVGDLPIYVLPLGPALAWLSRFLSNNVRPECQGDINTPKDPAAFRTVGAGNGEPI